MRSSTRLPFAALTVLLGVACSQPQPQRCIPGKSEGCVCAGARPGVQVCDAEGLSFSACDCAAASGGGAAGGGVGGGAAGCSARCALPCGQNGQCIDAATGPACACNTGYAGLLCTQCASGFQDNDGNGSCLPTCATLGLTCSSHGSCTEQSGTATCTCANAYTGLNCAGCAAGFQDHDGDGTCRAACGTSTCAGHGTCVDTAGEAACTCASGYSGPGCTACASGFQDNDGNGTCSPSCTNSTCSSQGTCADSSGTATCSCAMGHAGASCSTCAAGFQDNDGNGRCLPACSASTCSGHGACADSTGAATCTCAAGYTGASCATCASGFQDNDGDGSCLSSCATTTCERSAFCRDSVGPASCVCHTGYSAADGGASCVWSGGLRDPALIDSPPGQWQVDGGWQWSVADGGVITLTMCAHQGSFIQRDVVMPPASTEPLALLMSFQGSGSTTQGFAAKVGQSVVMTNSLQGFPQTRVHCLGEGAMTNGPTTVEVRTATVPLGSCFFEPATLDHLEIVPARTLCPAIGTVTNGDFEGAGGWLLGTTGAGASANIVAGAVDSTNGLRLSMATECELATGATTMSVPLASTLPNAALRFNVRGTSGSGLEVSSGPSLVSTARVARVVTTGSVVTQTVCLPSAVAGNVVAVRFLLQHIGAASCGVSEPRTVELDDVQLVSDPACTGGEVLNAGFESANDGAPWIISAQQSATARIVIDPSQARSGWGYFRASTGPCYGSSAEQLIKVPVSASGAGPAVRFFYRRSGGAGTASARFTMGSFVWATDQSLPTALNWTRAVVCLPSSRAGLPVSMVFSQYGGGGTCGAAGPIERLDIDDVEVTTDSTCPP